MSQAGLRMKFVKPWKRKGSVIASKPGTSLAVQWLRLPSRAEGVGSIPGWGIKIPLASRPKNQNIKQKQYCNKFNRGLKKWSTLKKKIFKINK